MNKIIWENSDFAFNKTNNWTESATGKQFTDYYFTIETPKRSQLLESIMEQGMQDISHIIVNTEKKEIILEAQYIWNCNYIPYDNPQMYDILFELIENINRGIKKN